MKTIFRPWRKLYRHTDRDKTAPNCLAFAEQIRAFKTANRKMKWHISEAEFDAIEMPPELSLKDRQDGFSGFILTYGFGDDGAGGADSLASARHAWQYAQKRRKRAIWQCEYVDFDLPEHIRLRPEAPPRPKGFYVAKIHLGHEYQSWSAARLRKTLQSDTGGGPELVQFLCITHPHFAELMNARQIPFMALADFDVAPYGYNDFFDVPQLFCSKKILGLGIGHVDQVYPLFGIPVIRFSNDKLPAAHVGDPGQRPKATPTSFKEVHHDERLQHFHLARRIKEKTHASGIDSNRPYRLLHERRCAWFSDRFTLGDRVFTRKPCQPYISWHALASDPAL